MDIFKLDFYTFSYTVLCVSHSITTFFFKIYFIHFL